MKVKGINRSKMYAEIIEILKERNLTAHEIALIMFRKNLIAYPIRGECQPRITELKNLGKVRVVAIKEDFETRKMVSVYSLVRGAENE